MKDDKNKQIVFAHYLVRILCDLFADVLFQEQNRAKWLIDLYKKNKICISGKQSTRGVDFYTTTDNTLDDLLQWLDQKFPEGSAAGTAILSHINHSFKWYTFILDELAQSRRSTLMKNIHVFFGNADHQRKMSIIAAGLVTAVGTGLVISKVLS